MGTNGCINGLLQNTTGVSKIDLQTQEISVLVEGILSEGHRKWQGGLVLSDGTKIAGFPNNSDSVLLVDRQGVVTGKLVLQLKKAFNERNTALLDRLARYLRARIPEVRSIHALHRDGEDIF